MALSFEESKRMANQPIAQTLLMPDGSYPSVIATEDAAVLFTDNDFSRRH